MHFNRFCTVIWKHPEKDTESADICVVVTVLSSISLSLFRYHSSINSYQALHTPHPHTPSTPPPPPPSASLSLSLSLSLTSLSLSLALFPLSPYPFLLPPLSLSVCLSVTLSVSVSLSLLYQGNKSSRVLFIFAYSAYTIVTEGVCSCT